MHFLPVLATLVLGMVSAIAAQDNSSVFSFPEYPPPLTPPPDQTLADSTITLPANQTGSDPALTAAKIHYDTGVYGPTVELVHAYYGYWPIGVAVSSDERIFTTFQRGNETFTLAEVNSTTTEIPFPDEDTNTPPAFADPSNPGVSVATDKLIFVQAVVIDSLDRIWALDVGRPRVNGSILLAATPGGPKLVGFYPNGTRFTTITFPTSVVAGDSALNDVRIDLRGDGFAYISDSSPQRPGIVVVNLNSQESWRHLNNHLSTVAHGDMISFHNGVPTYIHPLTSPFATTPYGSSAANAMALSADGAYLYFAPQSGRHLFRIPTSFLQSQPSATNANAIILANQAVQHLGDVGSHLDGLETDDQGYIYLTAPEHNAINRFNPSTGMIEPFVRSPFIQWPDTLSVTSLKSGGNYLYFTCNQLWLSPDYQNGTDLRTKPYAMFRVPIDGGKASQM
ncbi:hypothetical protein GY45DRAFT_761613 [Cubamyces sp. BRFM 1775]|nr:hypothetical protein GY45DRAFT_761613 [Cubamyces sp. BRFM 1775]